MFKRAINFSIIILVIAFSFGCATTQSIPAEQRSRIYNRAFKDTFRSVVQALNERGYSIEQADSDTGIINTDFKSASTLEAFLTGDSRTKINAIIADQNNGTKVTLTIKAEKKGALTGWESQSMTKKQAKNMYNDVFSDISKKVNS